MRAWRSGFFAACLPALPLPWVALSLGLDSGLELWRRPGSTTTLIASTLTCTLPLDSGLALELGTGAGALPGGALVVPVAVELPVFDIAGGPPSLASGFG